MFPIRTQSITSAPFSITQFVPITFCSVKYGQLGNYNRRDDNKKQLPVAYGPSRLGKILGFGKKRRVNAFIDYFACGNFTFFAYGNASAENGNSAGFAFTAADIVLLILLCQIWSTRELQP